MKGSDKILERKEYDYFSLMLNYRAVNVERMVKDRPINRDLFAPTETDSNSI